MVRITLVFQTTVFILIINVGIIRALATLIYIYI